MITKILFTGTQGTGKTTLLNKFKEAGYDVITEVVRTLVKEKGIKINEIAEEKGQALIMDTIDEKIRTNNFFVADRCWFDAMAYTKWSFEQGRFTGEFYWDQLQKVREAYQREKDNILVVYFPIEFPLVNDGVRSTDEEYRKQIDLNIMQLLKGVDCITIHGTTEERFDQVLNALDLRQSIARSDSK